jgi:hypothetical protein
MPLVSSFVEAAFAITGVGGRVISAFFMLSREITRKNIFSYLARLRACEIISLIIFLSFVVSRTGISAWVYNGNSVDKPVRDSPRV